jgi:hypothetical protein
MSRRPGKLFLFWRQLMMKDSLGHGGGCLHGRVFNVLLPWPAIALKE